MGERSPSRGVPHSAPGGDLKQLPFFVRLGYACGVPLSVQETVAIVDDDGKKKAVVVPVAQWKQILEALEELDDIRAYDKVKSHPSESVPFEQAVREIREGDPD